MEAENQSPAPRVPAIADARQCPRFKLEVEILIRSRSSGLLKGRSVDISESGMGAIMIIEAPLGEVVRLCCTLPFGEIEVHAMVRQRNAFRYGFQFVDPEDPAREIIRRTCHHLAFRKLEP